MVDFLTPATSVINPIPFKPEIWVMNASTETMADYWIRVSIKDANTNELKYRDSLQVPDSLYSAADTFWALPEFALEYLMQYFAYAEVWKDTFTGVDTVYFSTYDADAMVSATYDPVSPQNYMTNYAPNADFTNNGTQTLTFYAHCDIYENNQKAYSDSFLVTNLTAGNTDWVVFNTFYAPHYPGTSAVVFYTNMKHDVDRTNDTISYDITINGPISMWTPLDPTTSTSTQWAGRCMDDNGNLYIVGGLDNVPNLLNTVQIFNSASGWSNLPAMPVATFAPACAVIDSKLIVIDGGNLSFSAIHATQIYDFRTASWTTGTLSPKGLLGMGGGVVDGKMYLLGGFTAGNFQDTVFTFSYDVTADTAGGTPWTTHTFYYPGHGVLLGSPFYGVSGENQYAYVTGAYQGYHDFYRFEPAADTVGGTPWVTLAPTPADVGGKNPSLVTNNGEIYCIAGDYLGDWGAYSNKAYKYDAHDNLWNDIGFNLNTSVEGNVGWMFNDTLRVHGGTIGSYAIVPAPFEMCVPGETEGDFYAPYIVSTKPYDRQVDVYLAQTVSVAFSEPIDTSLWVEAVVSPDPGLLLMAFNESLDSLFIFHDDFKDNQTYYISFDIFYDTMGYRSIVKTVPYTIGFSTGPTGINSPYERVFKLSNMDLVAKPNSSFDFMLYSSTNERISIEIYSLLGNKVRDLSIENAKTGINKVSWNLKNKNNEKVSAGVYFFKIMNSKDTLEGKIIVTK
ncbi:MAG: T9SS type A sorting domain-containing protein [bacterium]